ncbi:MAG: DedA family protein [Calditrichaeota bacterium]|nr:DedA family protein [Calditrichota bacterium]
MNFVEDYGYFGLFLFCLMAATIIPVSSEGAVAGALLLEMKSIPVLIWASLGNILGTVINYFIGLLVGQKWLDKKINKSTQKAYEIAHKYGWWSLLLSWLPIIGDPITIVAGVLRWNFLLFSIIVFTLRIARYYALIYFFV